ncbi:glutamate--tRNA ligase family protein [Candidatus Mycobacterium wuenschmannii]|uniref:Glutamate--tRNA ligase family protein n=1 Tax=Candidatus Mycobacterium wuenschmannii TaxID=3027808 RepID=A0ABY8W0X2_9MYCO|nr:glutamate--tRNA ligase family protein [Candidatus Mycobacterium wuenschmannii]WIM88058.1 glutamate--tRNA ligase family protein [Candidatus Mycobacterium wuenschmannii]
MLEPHEVDRLFPADLPEVGEWERRYPPRDLPADAQVTRLAPSPTGFIHLGGIYTAMIDLSVARETAGRYFVRIEDTDQSREVEGAYEQFSRAFDYFRVIPDEGVGEGGDHGPYRQSERSTIYLSYAREALRSGKAYLCFATADQLTEIRTKQQQLKRPTGYYGEWALWRDADDAAVREQLEQGTPFVVRFRSPGRTENRATFTDAIRGQVSMEDNYNDVVILKSSAAVQLPTYHFAHAVDDHLMRCNLVIRGEEWLSSTALHLQLFEALGFEPPVYAHIALLMKQIPGGKRKLSKRKDPEADVDFYIRSGYPADAVLYYLRGLANGRLAEMPLPEALAAPISLADCGGAGPLVDLVKLEDISADYVATLGGAEIYAALTTWAAEFDPEVHAVIEAHPDHTLAALAVERDGAENPRKDLRKWSDFRPAYGFFFAELFTPVGEDDDRLGGLPVDLVRSFAGDFVASYQDIDDPAQWFQQIRDLAEKFGFAANAKEYKKNPDAYPGSIREASQLIRVGLTGSTRSPDLFQIARTLGRDEVLRRIGALTV